MDIRNSVRMLYKETRTFFESDSVQARVSVSFIKFNLVQMVDTWAQRCEIYEDVK